MIEDKQTPIEETISRTGDVITQKPVNIEVSYQPKNIFIKFLISIKILSNKRVFELRPIVVGNMLRIASKVVLIPDNFIDNEMISVLMNGSHEHMDKLVYIVACGLQNNRKEPSKRLLEFVKYEFTTKEIALVISNILMQMNAKDFMKSIVLIKGLNVLSVPEKDALPVTTQV